jgi:hypothetical protein
VGPQRVCYVTWVVAKENLWEQTNEGREIEKARRVATSRTDVEISERTARLLKDVWRKMLVSVRPAKEEMTERVIPVDPTIVEFSIQRISGLSLSGEVNVFLPKQGQRVERLLKISDLLVDYCKAPPSKRSLLEKEINRTASELLARLNRR